MYFDAQFTSFSMHLMWNILTFLGDLNRFLFIINIKFEFLIK